MVETTKIYLSHSGRDREKLAWLYHVLAEDPDLTVLSPLDEVPPSQERTAQQEMLIRQSDTVLFVLSPNSAGSDACAGQLDLAESLNKRVIPIVIEYVDGPVPAAVSKLDHIFATDRGDSADAIASIKAAINSNIGWIREHTRHAERAGRWHAAARPEAQVLRGSDLQIAETWLVHQPKDTPHPTQEQRRFVLESRKSATRRQQSITIGAVAALVVVSLLGILGWTQRNAAQDGERKAEAALRTATETSGALLSDLARELPSTAAPRDMIRNVLGQAQALHSTLMETFAQDRMMRDSDAAIGTKVGDALYVSGNLKAARDAYLDAQAKQLKLLEETPDHPMRQHALAVTLDRMGDLARAQGNPLEAQKYHASALELFQALDGVNPSLSRHGLATAQILDKLGQTAFDDNDLSTAEDLFTQARDLRAALIKRDAPPPDSHEGYADSLRALAQLARKRGNLSAAQALLEQALEIRERLVTNDPDNAELKRDTSALLDDLADLALQQGNVEQRRTYLERALALTQAIVEIDPQNDGWQHDLAVTLAAVATLDQNAGNYDAAVAHLEQGRSIAQRLVLISPGDPQRHYNLARIDLRLAHLAELMDNPDAAAARFQAAGDILGDLAAERPENATYAGDLGAVFASLGTIALQNDDLETAARNQSQALEWRRRAADLLPDAPATQRAVTLSLYEVASLEEAAEDYDAALTGYREMLGHARALTKSFPQDSDLADDLHVAGDLFAKQAAIVSFGDVLFSRLDKAEALTREALEAAPDNRRVAAHLAYALMFQEETDAAREIFLAQRGNQIDGAPWEEVVQQDFETFRKIGLTHPLMREIEAAF